MRKYLLAFSLLLLSAPAFSQSKSRGAKSDGLPFTHSLSLTPFSGMVTYGQFNPGAGFDYEYIFNKEAGIGVHLPVMVGFSGPEQDDFFYGGSYRHTVAYAAPGIRFHTGRRGGHVDFATGPSVLIGNMHFRPTDNYYSPAGLNPFNYGMLGIMADNSLNFYRGHFAFGLDLRVGSMLERQEGTRFFIHFGMHFGGIF